MDCLKTRYVASVTLVQQIYVNDDPRLTLTKFTARSNLDPQIFEWAKLKMCIFLLLKSL